MNILEYLSQSNNIASFDPQEQEGSFKFIDNLTFLEIVNLLSIGTQYYDIKNHVASDVSINSLPTVNKNTLMLIQGPYSVRHKSATSYFIRM